MKEEIFSARNEEELTHYDFDWVYTLNLQKRPDLTAEPKVVEETGELIYPFVQAYDKPSLKLRVIRTKPENGEEDLLVLVMNHRDTETGRYIEVPSMFSRANATEADICRLWPNYKPDMSRDEIFALPTVTVEDAKIRRGLYVKKDEDGNIVTDLDGRPIITRSTKWLHVKIDGKVFELSGDKRAYTAPIEQEPEKPEADDTEAQGDE